MSKKYTPLGVGIKFVCVVIMNMNKSSIIKHLFKEDKFDLVPNQTSIGVWFDKVLVELQFYK